MKTDFGGTIIEADVENHKFDGGSFRSLKIQAYPNENTDVITTIKINSINSEDLMDMSKLFADLAKSVKKMENKENKRSK